MAKSSKNIPIGIFDSGIGGLTVVKEIIRQLPNESIIYLGDTARVPYGTRSKEIVIKFAKELAGFLLKKNVKCLVIACNTISAVALEEIEKMSSVPVIGVVKPAVRKAVGKTKLKKIGVIGTRGTIQSKIYEMEIKSINPSIEVFSTDCPLFVPLVEEGLQQHRATKLLAEDYLKNLIHQKIDTLILGCTHYPLLIETIAMAVGSDVKIIDSAEPTAAELKSMLEEKDLLARNNKPTYKFFVTDSLERVNRVAEEFFGKALNANLKQIILPTL